MAGKSIKDMSSKFSKLEKFEGQDFRRWKKKMHFLLTTLKVVTVLTTPMPAMPEALEEEALEQLRRRLKWENDDYICRGHILNGMCDALFDVYQNAESARDLWDSLDNKYTAEDASSKKFLVSNFNSYKISDNRPIIDKFNELQHILGFQAYLETQKRGNKFVQLGSDIRIEESLRIKESGKLKGKMETGQNSVNLVEKDGNFKKGNQFIGNKRKDDLIAWWVDSGATSHVCKDSIWFVELKLIKDGSVLRMGNVSTEPIEWIRKVKLLFTSGKHLLLDNVLYVPGIRKNLISGIVLNSHGFKQVIESDKYVLSKHGLSDGFWGDAMLTACYLLNRTSNKNNDITPYELWKKRSPNLQYLIVRGCRAVVRLTDPKIKNLGEKGIDFIFIGYAKNSKAYRFYVIEPNDSVSINTIIESRDAIFDEERFTSIPHPTDMGYHSRSRTSDSTDNTVVPPEPRKSTRARKDNLKTFGESMASRDANFWKEDVQDEIDSIMHNKTSKLVDLPPGCKPLGCKWIFKRKMKVYGSIDKYKARLVIQGDKKKV
ncbi:uncharacterized protein LOC143629677 [Bidens hawaiensis]|uniref:uncharacterized protein LOC143629677 n=1 Tax=Bidens hawaiensis TaxID=980011 RepID=UPI004048FC29